MCGLIGDNSYHKIYVENVNTTIHIIIIYKYNFK